MTKARIPAETKASQIPFPTMKDWHAVLALVLLVGIYFRDIIFQKFFLWEDFLYQFYPFRHFAAVSMAHGEIPLWNPYTFNGTPFQADIQSALFYLPNVLLTLFVSGDRLHFYWVELLTITHYALAGICMYYLARSFEIERIFALFSGIVFTFSGFMVTHAIHEVIICQVAWFPLVLLLFRKALLQRSLLHTILGGVVLGHALLAGFPQLTLYFCFFLLMFFLMEFVVAVRDEGFKPALSMILPAAGTIVFALALTGIQLLPTLELAPISQRAEISYAKSQEGALAVKQLITILVPKFFGSTHAQGSDYWGPGVYWAYWETCLYAGVVALAAMAFSFLLLRKNRYVAFFFGTILFALSFAVGDHFVLQKLFFYYVPGFDKFRNPGRMSLFFTMSIALLSGFGFQNLFRLGINETRKVVRVLAFLIAGGAIVLLIAYQGFLQPTENRAAFEQVHPLAVAETKAAAVLLAAACAVLYLSYKRKLTATIGVMLLLALQFADMHMFGFDQNNGTLSPEEYYSRTADLVSMLKSDGQKEYFRVNTRQGSAMLLDRNQGMIDRISLLEGYTPLSLQRVYPPARNWSGVCDLLNAKYRIVVDQQQRSMELGMSSTYVPRAFMVYEAAILADNGKISSFMTSDTFDPRKAVVLEEDPNFTADTAGMSGKWSANITSYGLNSLSLTVTTPVNGYLVLSEVYYPGWNAYVDGAVRKIYRADWNLRAIPVEAGNHKVDVKFEPESYHRGAMISLATVGLSAIGIVYSVMKRRKHPKPTPTAA